MVSKGAGEADEKVPGRAYRRKKPTYRRPTAKGVDHEERSDPSSLDPGALDFDGRYPAPDARQRWPRPDPTAKPTRRTKTTTRVRTTISMSSTSGAGSAKAPRASGSTGAWRRSKARPLALAGALLIGGYAAYQVTFGAPLAPTSIVDTATRPNMLSGETADAQARAQSDAALGTFEPVEYSGSDNETLQLPDGVRNAVVVVPSGSSIKRWTALDAKGENVDRSSYVTSGSPELLMSDSGFPAAVMEVEGTGEWTIQLWPFSALPALPRGGQSDGSTRERCFLYGGPGGLTDISYEGDSYFTVRELTPPERTTLLSADGQVSATRTLARGPSALCLSAYEGRWTITAP